MKINFQELLASLPSQVVSHIQHLERIRQDFVANVSHELRTPLTVMHGYLETLLDQPDLNETWKKIFLQMHQQTLRMENLIENLLLLSRLESQEHENKSEHVVPVFSLLQQVCHEANAVSGEASHNIILDADEKLMLKGCDIELRSLFSNIIFNAVKYTSSKGKINIEWYKNKEAAYFAVKDTGIGISADHLPRITERFYRVDPARSRASGGTGLGLAIAKHVLIRHDAQLTIESVYGEGSVFTCIFPSSRMIGY
jgi:two-component system phosphate regulon sensor histidine kinase PhoR